MYESTTLDQVVERVERLLMRHEELQRTNRLLAQELAQVTHDRDLLKARLQAARTRVDALLQRLPGDPDATTPASPSDRQDLV